jgi:hypothetical protein
MRWSSCTTASPVRRRRATTPSRAINGLYKSRADPSARPWKTKQAVELATLE